MYVCTQEGGPNHYWISGTDVPYKFELGAQAHEGCAGIVALTHYLQLMAGPSSGQLGCTPPAGSTTYQPVYEAQHVAFHCAGCMAHTSAWLFCILRVFIGNPLKGFFRCLNK